MQPRSVRRQVHRGQDPFGDVLGLDEGDEAQLGVALRADNERPSSRTGRLALSVAESHEPHAKEDRSVGIGAQTNRGGRVLVEVEGEIRAPRFSMRRRDGVDLDLQGMPLVRIHFGHQLSRKASCFSCIPGRAGSCLCSDRVRHGSLRHARIRDRQGKTGYDS
jgi:hypothetical protein